MRTAIAAAASATADDAVNALGESGVTRIALKAATGAGGSLALRETARILRDEGKMPIVVAPPPRQIDTAALALAGVAACLDEYGLAPMSVHAWLEPRSWRERLELIKEWILEAAGVHSIALLVDDPSQWATPGANEIAWRSQAVLDMLLAESTPIPRVVVRSDLHDRIGEHPVPCRPPAGVLEDETDWGEALAPVIVDLRASLPEIAAASPVAVGLAVGLAALASPEQLAEFWAASNTTSLPLLADELAKIASQDRRLRRFWASWLSLAMPRRPVPDEWVHDFALPTVSDAIQQAVLDRCLLARGDGTALVREARAASWRVFEDEFMARVRSSAASPLYSHYIEAMDRGIADGTFDSCHLAAEVLNLTRRVPEARRIDAVPVPFSDHLNNLGVASLEANDWALASWSFTLALEQDPDDAFALHHFGFSLDNEAREPLRVERSYSEALHLDPTHATWHERLISFLVVQARIGEAAQWFAISRGKLLPDDGDASVSVYARLHLPIAANLLRRAELPLTAAVLSTIPDWAHSRLPGLSAQQHRLAVLEAATDKAPCVPADRAAEDWWTRPELLGEKHPDGRPLQVWLAASVEATSSDGLDLNVAVVSEGGDLRTGTTTVSWETIRELAQDSSRLPDLDTGDFLEIGYYGPGTELPNDPVIRILPRRDWESGIETPLDPARYISGSYFLQRST